MTGETASPEQRREAAQRSESPRVLPYHPYNLAKLRSIDADVSLNARKISARPALLPLIETGPGQRHGLRRVCAECSRDRSESGRQGSKTSCYKSTSSMSTG
jgi:hypothetical protein